MPLPGERLYANSIWIGPASPDNYMQGRAGYAVVGIVDHHSASSLQGLIYRFKNPPAVSGGGASAHFAIDREEETRDGLLGYGQYAIRYQLVDTADMAFADSNYFENLTTNAIEHVRQWGSGPGTAGYEPITDAQYRSSAELHMILSQDQGWPLDLAHVTPHNLYSQTTCPGDLDLARLTQGGDMPLTQADYDAIAAAVDAKVSGRLAEITTAVWDAAGTPGYAPGTGFLLQEIRKVQGATSDPAVLELLKRVAAEVEALAKHLGAGTP